MHNERKQEVEEEGLGWYEGGGRGWVQSERERKEGLGERTL